MARSKPKSTGTFKKILIAVVVSMIGIGIYNYYLENNGGFLPGTSGLSYDEAASKLPRVLDDVDWSENFVQRRATIDLVQDVDLKDTLPDIGQFSLVVSPPISSNDVAVEIFVSSEKSGKGTDGWMVETARAFNDAGKRLSSGRVAKIKIRKIASGTGYQFIASRKHLPQAYSPSNHLWIRMAEAHGIPVAPIREQLVGNIAGVVMKTEVAEKLNSKYGTLDVKNIIDAVVQGEIVMGYTNPFASSTGLNFLVTILSTFSGSDEATMLSPAVISAFEGFQRGVPFVALTTLQMRDSVEKGGALEAFVMEYQTFAKTPVLQSGYEFIPFGIKHDNPLYAVGDLTPDQAAALEAFAAFTDQAKYQDLANEYGFNPSLAYDPAFQIPAGKILIEAQKIWKKKKDAGRPIAAVFLADVSGSMGGSRIRGVKEALIRGSDFIEPANSIGLVLFSNVVSVVLPIKTFNLNQKAAFRAAVEDMRAGGGTAMYSGVAVALSMLIEAKNSNPNVKPVLFVLTDGQTNEGLSFGKMSPVIKGIRIPVYTIGYEADIKELSRLSSLVEAASLNASEGEIDYKIGSLLNAQM